MDAVSADLEAANPNFRNDLRQSQVAVNIVADWLKRRGHDAEVLELVITPSTADRADYTDDGDLRYLQKGSDVWRTGEVKHVQTSFTCAADFPYPVIIVDAKIKIEDRDEGKRDTATWFIVSKEKTHLGILRWSARPHWSLVQYHDKRLNRSRYFYTSPLRFVEFQALN